VDQRLVRDSYLTRCSTQALALYLLLVTVADAQGLSYYSDKTITQWLSLDKHALNQARQQLLHLGLIAFERPLYQVLALDDPPPTAQRRQAGMRPSAIIAQLRRALEGSDD
jgi:replication initiation and membrane attachment protein DnaB